MNPCDHTEGFGTSLSANGKADAVPAHIQPRQRHVSRAISPEHIAVLNGAAQIVSFNDLSCRIPKAADSSLTVGSDYTDVCGSVFRLRKEELSSVAVAIGTVRSGERSTCMLSLSSEVLAEGQRLQLRLYRLDGADSGGNTTTHVFVEAMLYPEELQDIPVSNGDGGLFSKVDSEVLQNIRHELRTPLNAVIGFSDLLLNEALEPAQLEKVGFVHQAANDLLELVNNIIDCSSPESEATQISCAPFKPRELIESVVRRTQRQSPYNVLQFECEYDPRIPQLLAGDSGRLRQTLRALLSNAVKFTKQGEVCVRTAVQESTDTGVTLQIDVSDTGIGIPFEDQDRIFEPFVQADSSTTRRFGGMGTGLALCRRLVTSMNGRIDLQSKTGKGSTFSLTLPLSPVTTPSRSTKFPQAPVHPDTPQTADTNPVSWTAQTGKVAPMPDASTQQDAWQEICRKLRKHVSTEHWKESESFAQQLRELADLRDWPDEADQSFRLVLAIRRRSPSQATAIITRLQQTASGPVNEMIEVAMS